MRVSGLYVYPLKSARGLSMEEAALDPFGLAGDRRWCVVDPEGRAITQRECPALATLDVRPSAGGITIRRRGREPLFVDVPGSGRSEVAVRVHDDRTEGIPASPESEVWLQAALGIPCRLVHMPGAVVRPVNPRYGRPGDRVSYADGYPLLLTSEASLADLNRRLDTPVPMDRFRANLVIDGEGAFAEDDWRRIRVGDVELRVVKPCARCVVITTDQRTGARRKEPLKTLSTYRMVDGRVHFGQNLIHEGPGTIRVGDAVEVLESRS